MSRVDNPILPALLALMTLDAYAQTADRPSEPGVVPTPAVAVPRPVALSAGLITAPAVRADRTLGPPIGDPFDAVVLLADCLAVSLALKLMFHK